MSASPGSSVYPLSAFSILIPRTFNKSLMSVTSIANKRPALLHNQPQSLTEGSLNEKSLQSQVSRLEYNLKNYRKRKLIPCFHFRVRQFQVPIHRQPNVNSNEHDIKCQIVLRFYLYLYFKLLSSVIIVRQSTVDSLLRLLCLLNLLCQLVRVCEFLVIDGIIN